MQPIEAWLGGGLEEADLASQGIRVLIGLAQYDENLAVRRPVLQDRHQRVFQPGNVAKEWDNDRQSRHGNSL